MTSGAGTIRVLVLEAQALMAEALSLALSLASDLHVIGALTRLDEATRFIADKSTIDVAVIDPRTAEGNPEIASRRIHNANIEVRIVLLVAETMVDQVTPNVIQAGCAGLVTRESTVESLVAAIRAVKAGEAKFPSEALVRTVRQLGRQHEGRYLTHREREVLSLMANGMSNYAIANKLGVSVNTVRNHIQNILFKLDVHSKLQAVLAGYRQGLITPSG